MRGLKLPGVYAADQAALSHRSRGAWIEILPPVYSSEDLLRRIAHAVRGLKYPCWPQMRMLQSSHRSRGAWIEIKISHTLTIGVNASHRSRGAWIEMHNGTFVYPL